MPKYRITIPTFLLIAEDGGHVAHMVPEGTIVSVERDHFDANKMVPITLDGQAARIFGEYLRSHGERIIDGQG